MPEGIDKGLLEEYIATANSGKYKSMAEVNAKFPELKDYSPDLLEEYVATANSGKYKTLDEVNSKFPEFSTSKTPAVPSFSTDISNTNTLPVLKNSPLQANVDKPVKVVAPTYIDPTKVLKTKDVVDINAEKAPKTMAQIDEESRITMQNRNIFTLTQRGLDESIEYQNLLVKKLAKELGYTDDNSLKGTTAVQKLANDRQEGWKEDYLEPEELAQVRAFEDYEVFKEQGKEKESNEALQKYLNSRTDYRKKIDNDIVDLKGELVSAEGDDAVLIRATIAELEAKKLPFYDPKKQMESFLTENETDVAAVSKPTETAQEKLKKYILAQDNLVTNLRNRLGITGKNNSFQRFTDEWKVLQGDRRQKDDLELLHNTELKIKNAVQILELNRTPLDKDSAFGVLAKEFIGELIPMKKGFSGIDNTIAANIGSIVQDADITYAANEKQVETAKFASNQYQFGSAKWVSQNLAPTLAIMVEMIPATLLTEGLGSAGYLSRLSRPLKILAERGSLGAAGGTFFKVIQANKYGRGLLKAAASGVNYGIESQAVTMLAPQLKDEMGFSNGLFAGTVGSIAGQLTGKVMETSLKSIATLFGNKAPQAIAAIEKYGSVIAKTKEFSNTVAGETVEEYGEQLMSIYKESDNYKNFIYNLKKHYETTDALEEFATILMMSIGAPAGSTLGKSLFSASKKAYNNLSRKERETASRMADEIHNEVNLAMDDAANQTIRDENIQVPTRSNEEQDNAILQKQKDLKLPTAPEVVLSDVSKATMAKMEGGEALTIEELKELSNELYQRYNGISATKDQDNRQFTTEQINETLIKLENNITLLENSKNKLEESGETSIVVNPNEAVTQDAKPVTSTPNTKFYQGVDFRAQTGLPNGDYTEEQVKAAREAKLKKEGVTPAEIETINAEQEVIPATETPAAPISGVSGEVQASGDVTTAATSENEIKAKEIGIKLDRLTEDFVSSGKTQKEAEDLAFKSISEEEKQVLRDSYNESRNQPKTKQNDKENGTGVQSNIGEGQEPIKTQPIETTGGEKIEASGNVQASEEEVVKPIADQIEDLRAKEKAEYDAMPNQKDDAKREKIYEKYNSLITPLLEQQKEEIKQAEKTTSVYVAPFYDATVKDIKEVKDIEKSPAYKKYIETMYSAAEALGIKIKKTVGNLGKYTHDTTGLEISEISTLVELETDDIEKATEFAVLMGALAPEVQESTISAQVLSEDEITPDRHTADFHNIKVDNIKEAAEIAALSGLDHTIIVADNTIQIISFKYWSVEENNEFDQKVENLIQKLKEKGINYETNTKAVESRFITASPSKFTPYNREDIIRRMEEEVGKNDGDTGLENGLLRRRQMLRDALQNAKIRNNEFLRQEKLASERAEYGKLRTKQIELEKNGERLSDEEIKRFTELLNILIPSTQETVKNASEDYEEARKELEKVAAKVIGDLGFLSTFGIKRAERAATKILRWYKGKAQWLGDGARTNLIAYNEKDVMVLYKKLQAQFKGGIIRLEKDPTELGYPKKLLEVRTSNGKIAEFQVMTPEGYLAKDGINGFPKDKRDFAAKELAKIQKRLGWLIPDGVGHYFYEIERDFNVPTDLRERAKAISLKYYNAFLKADSKYTEKEFLDEISQFKEDVDAADKTSWDKGNNGISPVTVNDFIEDTNNQYEPITVSDTSHDTFTKDNAIDYEEDEKEGDNGRSYTYLASVTVSLVDDVSGETIGSITKLKDEYGDVTWSAEDSDGSEVADNVGTKNEAQRALVEQHNKQKAKEFNKEKARGIKERTKQRAIEAEKAAKAKEKTEKEAAKAKEKAAKEQAPVVKEQAAPPVKAEEKEDKEQKEPVKEQVKPDALDNVIKNGVETDLDKKRNPNKKAYTKISDEISKDHYNAVIYAVAKGLIDKNNKNIKLYVDAYTIVNRDSNGISEMVEDGTLYQYIKSGLISAKEAMLIIKESRRYIPSIYGIESEEIFLENLEKLIQKDGKENAIDKDSLDDYIKSEDGTPLVLSHGTDSKYKSGEFEPNSRGLIHFSRKVSFAMQYGSKIINAYLISKKPFNTINDKKLLEDKIGRPLTKNEFESQQGLLSIGGHNNSEIISAIKSLGYDSIAYAQYDSNRDKYITNYIVFDKKNIQVVDANGNKIKEDEPAVSESEKIEKSKPEQIGAGLLNLLGIAPEDTDVKFSKTTGEPQILTSTEEKEQEIVDQMNKMNLVNKGIDLNPSFTTEETIDLTNLNSRLENPLKSVNWSQFKGMPFGFTISDQLTTGEAKNPSTGVTIKNLKGGIGFNGTEGNENNAWANTNKIESGSMYSKALEMYNNNKPLFEKLWKEGKLPAGHVPFAVVKMAESSIVSNEAIRRAGIENLKTLPEENRKKAAIVLKSELERKKKQEEENLIRGTKLKKVKGTPKGVTEYTDTKIPYTKNTVKQKDKLISQYKNVLAFLDKNNYEDVVDILKNAESFSLPEKALIFNEIFYGKPNKIGQPSKKAGSPSTLVSETLVKGLDKSKRELINIGVIADLITEPSMKNVPNMHVISIIGVKVAEENKNGKWVKAGGSTTVDHPNYKHGVEGKSIGILTQPVHMKDAFGEAYGNVLAQIIKNEAKRASISIDSLLTQAIPVQAGLPNLVLKSAIASDELDAVDKLAGFLRQAFPSTTFFTSEDAWDAAMEDPSIKKKLKDGDVVYAFTADGNVFINPTLKTTKAALHETGHIWMSFVKENNPALYAKGLQLVTNTREHQKAIKEYGDTELAREEALMELMSSKGDTIVRASDKAKFKEWLLSVYKYVADNFTSLLGLTPKQIENLTLDKFLEGMLADILSGKKVTTKKVKAEKEVKFSLESQNSKIRDYIEKQREAGESDKDIRAGVEMVADKLGLTKEDINNLMSENESTTTTEQAEFTPNAKDIKAFEKILGTTSGAIRNKNIADAVKINPKVQEIMDNFEELKKQLMASVELTEDCSW